MGKQQQNIDPHNQNKRALNSSVSGTDHLPERSLTQEELKYMCNQGGKTTPSYVDETVNPDLEF